MNHFSAFITLQKFSFFSIFNLKHFILFSIAFFIGCSSTKRLYSDDYYDSNSAEIIRVLLDNSASDLTITVNDLVFISDENELLAKVNSGNKLRFSVESEKVNLAIGDKDFTSKFFFITPSSENGIIKVNDKKYRGRILVSVYDSEVKIVNQISLEDYVKGVMIKEMPVGKGTENYQALKAFSICARTYAFNKMKENKIVFDIYPDTRDQVYGGVDGETAITNDIVDETKGQMLFYDNQPATIFYHSTCGGYTEDVINVFSKNVIPYLNGVKDGDEPFCKISPRYEWTESYSETVFINRLLNAKLIDNEIYKISNIQVNSRFKSGRVNELEIKLISSIGDEKIVLLYGNGMRTIIRSSDGKSILRSTLFEIKTDINKNVIINGNGNGHGVGMCQWGAIGQSKKNIDYRKILNHYFPGTVIKNFYD
ncbi:MAG: SpoIID/LytB domain-containing protein [Ignavibacteriaceae bacterium]|nr:SpoIID/LytB domain-containing protein [Ignavibacterium sp.]MCC6253589.1 SpoIID/LytB domain-containing protein [Ignavibacteriaceae bacterium]HMN25069.1 SpoIID/LytB domain-containing protein [Ignavibacteriaceae bacterium]HRN27442.1 SpoIID/LytB domain-containing protein [Ignavibacteriaceae bacterium]HRP93247.1 SpoIID/LytB domain-containing protein [Ignavibacteriaceae bacterium]